MTDRLARVLAEYHRRRDRGEPVDQAEFLARHPDLAAVLRAEFDLHEQALAAAKSAFVDLQAIGESPSPLDGRRMIGRYELLEEIGRGGMGVVYRARQPALDRIIAVKVIRAGPWTTDADARRLRIEAEAAARLRHPAIVTVHEVEKDDGCWFLAREFVEGESLARRLDAGPLPPDEAAQLMAEVADAIHHAHENGVIHRDLKPSNILIDAAGRPRITDFGLARTLDRQGSLTLTGEILGTPAYMPPEQAVGPSHAIGPPADVYGLGATLYALVTGHAPFTADNPLEILKSVVDHSPAAPCSLMPAIPRDLETVILKCLEKEPLRRYASAREVADDLRRFLAHRPIVARRPTLLDRAAKWTRRHPTAARFALTVLLVAVVGLTASLLAINRAYHDEYLARLAADAAKTAADADRDRAERAAYNLQLTRIGALWRSDPQHAMRLLDDRQRCPKHLRDFTWGLYRRLCRWGRQDLGRHEGGALCVAFSPNGKLLASGGKDNLIKLWQLPSFNRDLLGERAGERAATPDPTLIATLTGHTHWVKSLAFSPDGKTLASASRDTTVKLWNITAFNRDPAGERAAPPSTPRSPWGRPASESPPRPTSDPASKCPLLATLTAHTDRVESVAFTPDGKNLISAGFDGIRYWNPTTGEPLAMSAGNPPGTLCLAISPDGKQIASGGCDEAIRLWDAATKKQTARLAAPNRENDWVVSVAFSTDSSRLIAVGHNRTINSWDVSTGRLQVQLHNPDTPAHVATLRAGAISPDGRTLASAGDDRTIRFWNIESRQQQAVLTAHDSFVRAVAHSPTDGLLASAGDDGSVRLWEISGREGATLVEHQSKLHSVALSADGSLLATAGDEPLVRLWDVRRPAEHAQIIDLDAPVETLAVSPDGQRLATTARDGIIKIWDARNRKIQHTLRGHTQRVTVLEFSPDGTRLASGGRDRLVKLWNVAQGVEQKTITAHTDNVFAVAFSPDGRTLASGSRDKTLRLWNAATGDHLRTLQTENAVGNILFSPDAAWLALTPNRLTSDGPFSGKIRILDLPSLTSRLEIDGHADEIMSIAISTDGKTLATGASDRTIRLWDVFNGDQRAILTGHTHWVENLAFTPDRQTLISSGKDNQVRIWTADFSSPPPLQPVAMESTPLVVQQPRQALHVNPRGVCCVAYAPNGHQLAAGDADGEVRLFNTATGQLERTLSGPKSTVWQLAYSPTGDCLAVHPDRKIVIWDPETGQRRGVIGGPGEVVGMIGFSPDGKTLATDGPDESIAFWDPYTAKPRGGPVSSVRGLHKPQFLPDGDAMAAVLARHLQTICLFRRSGDPVYGQLRVYAPVWRYAVSPRGNVVAIVTKEVDEPVTVWRLTDQSRLHALRGHTAGVTSVAISPDETLLATGSHDGTARLWSLKTGQTVAVLPARQSGVDSVAFSPNGRSLATAGGDGVALIWSIEGIIRP